VYGNRNFLTFNPNVSTEEDAIFADDKYSLKKKKSVSMAEEVNKQEVDTLVVLANALCPLSFSKGVLPSILSEKFSIIFGTHDNVLPVLRNIKDPLIVHSPSTDPKLLAVPSYSTEHKITWHHSILADLLIAFKSSVSIAEASFPPSPALRSSLGKVLKKIFRDFSRYFGLQVVHIGLKGHTKRSNSVYISGCEPVFKHMNAAWFPDLRQ
jgi:hypothetical protein